MSSTYSQSKARLDVSGRRRYATVTEAAAYISANRRFIYEKIATGELTRYAIGKRFVRVDLNQLDTLMEAGGVA